MTMIYSNVLNLNGSIIDNLIFFWQYGVLFFAGIILTRLFLIMLHNFSRSSDDEVIIMRLIHLIISLFAIADKSENKAHLEQHLGETFKMIAHSKKHGLKDFVLFFRLYDRFANSSVNKPKHNEKNFKDEE